MFAKKAINLSMNEETVTMEDHIKNSDIFKNSDNARVFKYELNEKATKSKLIKGAKKNPFEVEENSTTSNLVFSLGAWYTAVLPAVSYWKEVMGDQTCKVGDYSIKIGGLKTGKENSNKNIDTQVVGNNLHKYHNWLCKWPLLKTLEKKKTRNMKKERRKEFSPE